MGVLNRTTENGIYKTTDLGDAWVQALCNTPPPRKAFVDEQGRILIQEQDKPLAD